MLNKEEKIKAVKTKLFALKIELNSNYGFGLNEVKRFQKILKKKFELEEELKILKS